MGAKAAVVVKDGIRESLDGLIESMLTEAKASTGEGAFEKKKIAAEAAMKWENIKFRTKQGDVGQGLFDEEETELNGDAE